MPNKRYNGTKHGVPTVNRKTKKKRPKPHEATMKQGKGRKRA